MCLKPRQNVDRLNQDVVYNTYNEELDHCDYVDYGDSISVDSNDLVIMQLTVHGLYSKMDQIKSLLDTVTTEKKLDVLMLCETWQSKNSPIPDLPRYDYIHKARTNKLGGGVGILISDNLTYKTRSDLEINTETIKRCIAELKLKTNRLLLCSGYRAPGNNPSKFVDEYSELLFIINGTGLPVIMGLDHNLDLLKHKSHSPTLRFIEKNLDLDMIPCITKPTRITKSSATLIDNIFIP